MSSSYIVEPSEGKKDDTLILMVNDNGVISVDQDTLQSLILNQSNASVSVVRLGQTDNDVAEGNITLTVDPPPIISTEINITSNAPDSTTLVDPFMEMDAEQLERLETALQSEEAKQILGENVTAMLDMLTVEEQQNSIRYSIELDHCYTSKFLPSQSKSTNQLSHITTFDIDQSMCIDFNKSISPMLLPVSSANINNACITSKQKVTSMLPKIVKQPSLTGGRIRRTSITSQPITSTPKSTFNANIRTISCTMQQKGNLHVNDKLEGDELFSSSESSESERSDSDSDFGPKTCRRSIRARGGRKGLTTRGGFIASRRRSSNKQMDSEQVRRLDLEMAAAVSAMKSPEKDEKYAKKNIVKIKKQLKTFGTKKKNDSSLSVTPVSETSSNETNTLQTTNSVKANLISANMFKGDMILTKPGQDRNAKVVFLPKQVVMNPNEIKTIDCKKHVTVQKNKLILSQTSKPPVLKDAKVISPTTIIQKSATLQQNLISLEMQTEPDHKISQILKIKSVEMKKEKKKVDTTMEIAAKSIIEPSKSVETKTQTAQKKIVKKEHRKSDTLVVESLGPALFSTPDIIRRVGSVSETKVLESSIITPIALPSSVVCPDSMNPQALPTVTNISHISNLNFSGTISSINTINMLNKQKDMNLLTNNSMKESMTTKCNTNTPNNALIFSEAVNHNMSTKVAVTETHQLALDLASNPSSSKEISLPMEQTVNLKHHSIEGVEDDNLLTSLEIEAAKQLPNDEELLAEAILLQETLDVDLDQSGLGDPTPEMPESNLSSTIEESTSAVIDHSNKKVFTSPFSDINSQDLVAKIEPHIKKDIRNPVQIVRGGRIITLPPIEAPATRSKRLQAKIENRQVRTEKKQQFQQQLKVEPLIIKTERASLQKQDMIYDMEDDEEEEEEANSDSEDDPNRLWCICRQPHNNRFMICCDICQDWFHGKCVHVTKAMGEQMESQGIEWVCPNCLKKKTEENKFKSVSKRQKGTTEIMPIESNSTSPICSVSKINDVKFMSNSGKTFDVLSGITHCVVCKKEARKSSIYCSDACILAHAEVTSTKDRSSLTQTKGSKTDIPMSKLNSDVKIIVFDKKTGKVLTGADAPTMLNLKIWLKEHPTYEVVKSNHLNNLEQKGKTVATFTQGIKTNKLLQEKSTQPKMVYSKVIGSKQTVLTSSAKKAVLLTDIPSTQSSITSSQSRLKQVNLKTGKTSTSYIKQTTVKTALQQQILQRPVTLSKPKPVLKKLQEVKASTHQQQQQHISMSNVTLSKKPETEPIRLNVRKTLAELLHTRIKETSDLKLNEEDIMQLALQIELEMFKFFKETGAKYKAKYRSLVFNIKDTKNLTLFRKIADRSLGPDAVVKLSPDEMASQELAEWREKENKHQLEMIKKNELDLMSQAKSIVVKTHKGELIIETDGTMDHVDAKTSVQDIVTALNSREIISSTVEENNKQNEERLTNKNKTIKVFETEKKRKDKERNKEKRRCRSQDRINCNKRLNRNHRHSRERSKEKKSKDYKYKDRTKVKNKACDKIRDRNKKKDKNKDKKDKYKLNSSRSYSKSGYKEHKDKYKKDEENKNELEKNDLTVSGEKAIEERLWRHIEDETTNTLDGNDSDISDREPSSTVTIKTPDINEDNDKDIFEQNLKEGKNVSATVWRGFVYMADVAKFFVTAQNVSGNSKNLMEDLPDTFDVVGRINPLTVWDYIGKMKKNATKEILIIKLTATNDEEKIPYITLYSYLNSRNRLGVLGNISPNIKDFYIMPFSNGSKLPSVLLPLDALELEENRQHLLLGIIVVQRKKRSFNCTVSMCPVPSKILKKEQQPVDRSYTPPTAQSQIIVHDESMTPPNSPKVSTQSLTHDIKQNLSVISKIVPELSSKISLGSSSSSDKMQLDDDDEPYSPGEPVDIVLDDNEDELSTSSKLKLIKPMLETKTVEVKSSTELQRKMEELSRQIEEEKQQIQNISSSFLSDAATTLPGLGLALPDSGNGVETYSTSEARSFTPPPQDISKFSQPILDKVSNITIPPNLQEILANVKRQENCKVDSYLPSKPSATFLTTVTSKNFLDSSKYSQTYSKTSNVNRLNVDMQSSFGRETKGTLSSLSDYDIMKKAEEELAALAGATISAPSISIVTPTVTVTCSELPPSETTFEIPHR